jgi:SagB-type dehydrogenase family enzyme
MIAPNDDHSLAMLFHLNSEAAADRPEYHQLFEAEFRGLSGAGLPLPRAPLSPVLKAILARRSCRQFSPEPMPLVRLASLLFGAAGVTGVVPSPGLGFAYTRAVPSAGGLYPVEVYVRSRGVEGIGDGLYHYDVRGHSLEASDTKLQLQDWSSFLPTAPLLAQANAVFFLTGVFDRSMKKYGARGYRFVLMEAGHVAQNLCLLAAEAGLGSICIGGYRDAALNAALGFNGVEEGVVYVIGVGRPA